MDSRIIISEEGPRGCGYRKAGGLYLRCDGLESTCCRLPLPLDVCPCCGAGIKPARGWTWLDVDPLVAALPECRKHRDDIHGPIPMCPLGGALGTKAGLLWIGERYYPSPESFEEEARRVGVSRRITTIPRGFEIGKTWVLIAHRKTPGCGDGNAPGPGIFHAFRPTRIEQVVSEDATTEEIDKLEKRGIVPVAVRPVPGENPADPQLSLGAGQEAAQA